jgi:hypothetical protein
MPSYPVDKLYDWATSLPSPAGERILAAALEQAETPYSQRIIALLFEMDTDAAWGALIANYPRLAAADVRRLLADSHRLRAGFAAALRYPSPRARLNALATLQRHPCPTLSYLLPEVLRDTSADVRRATGATLRRLAELVLDQKAGDDNEELRRQHEQDRAEVVKAMREAVRTFDLHYCAEVLEVALWLAADFGETLWQTLGSSRSHVAYVVSAQLRAWNSPRLARFLLEALAQPGWRGAARELLIRWCSPAEVSAILQNTDVLRNPLVRRQLALLKRVRWFDQLGLELQLLPPELRGWAPRWLYHLGFEPREKTTRLVRWLASKNPTLHRDSAYALAALDPTEATTRLAHVAIGRSPAATFARWYVAGRRAVPIRRPSPPPVALADTPSTGDPFSALWHQCRQSVASDDDELIRVLRRNILAWQYEISSNLRSADAGDRLLALRILADSPHVGLFADDIEPLLSDPVEAIRHIALKIHDGRQAAPRMPTMAGPSAFTTDDPPTPTLDERTTQARQLLAQLLTSDTDAQATVDVINRIRTLLQGSSANAADLLDALLKHPEGTQ